MVEIEGAQLDRPRLTDRLAHLQRHEQGDVVAVTLDEVRPAQHHGGPLTRLHPRPGAVVERAPGGGDGPVDVRVRRRRDLDQDRPVPRRDDRQCAVAVVLAAVDQHGGGEGDAFRETVPVGGVLRKDGRRGHSFASTVDG